MEVHHASQGGGEPHAVGDGAVAVKSNHLVLLCHVVQKTETRKTSFGFVSIIWIRKCTQGEGKVIGERV